MVFIFWVGFVVLVHSPSIQGTTRNTDYSLSSPHSSANVMTREYMLDKNTYIYIAILAVLFCFYIKKHRTKKVCKYSIAQYSTKPLLATLMPPTKKESVAAVYILSSVHACVRARILRSWNFLLFRNREVWYYRAHYIMIIIHRIYSMSSVRRSSDKDKDILSIISIKHSVSTSFARRGYSFTNLVFN